MPATYRPARYATAARHAFSETGDAIATSTSERATCSDNVRWKCEHTGANVIKTACGGVFPIHIPEMWECEERGDEKRRQWAGKEILAACGPTRACEDDTVLPATIPRLTAAHTRISPSLDTLLSRQICSRWTPRSKPASISQNSSFWIYHFLWYHLRDYSLLLK